MAVISDRALDPGSRALLDLTLRQGVSDAQVAEIVGADADEIAGRRADALGEILDAGEPAVESAESVVAVAERILAEARAAEEEELARRAAPERPRGTRLDLFLRVVAAGYLALLLVMVVVYKAAFVELLTVDPVLRRTASSCASTSSAASCSACSTGRTRDAGIEPNVAIVMPAFNEEDAIGRFDRARCCQVDYPHDKLEIVASTTARPTSTLARDARASAAGRAAVRVIAFAENRGKRAAMAAGIRATTAEIVAFVDSDSALEPDALRSLVQGFAEPKVGAICRPCRRAELARVVAHAHAGGALLRRVPRLSRRRSRSSARSPAARAASPPTAARRSSPCSSGGRTSASSASRRRSATTAR